ncbi:hypothetical protein SLE2022_369710 [Rubroshorea leprosula]
MESPLKTQKHHFGAQVFLRTVAIGTTMAAIWLMMTSKEIAIVFGLPFEAKYSYMPAFKFFACANGIACAFIAASLLLFFIFGRIGLSPTCFFILFLHDLFTMLLVLSGISAATAVGLVGRNGNSHAGWMPICDNLTKFCFRVTLSTVFGCISFILLLVLTIMAANKYRQISV